MHALKLGKALLVSATLMLVAGCNTNGPNSTFEELGQDGNTRGFGRQFPQDPEGAFTFGVGDSMLINVENTPEFSGAHVIRSDGRITMPLVNDVIAAGLTTEQLAGKVETLIALYVKEPRVTVSVVQVRSKALFVATHEPQTGGLTVARVPYQGDTLIWDAFVQMGAPVTLLSDWNHVKVIRGDPRRPTVYNINLEDIMSGYTGANIQLRPDDIVYVPPTLFGHINRYVAGVSQPFQSLFQISRSFVDLDTSIRIIRGDDAFRRNANF